MGSDRPAPRLQLHCNWSKTRKLQSCVFKKVVREGERGGGERKRERETERETERNKERQRLSFLVSSL